MEERKISFETAKLYLDKGIDFEIFPWNYACYRLSDKKIVNKDAHNKEEQIGDGHLPTQSLLQKWLRETQDILIFNVPDEYKENWGYIITSSQYKNEKGNNFSSDNFIGTYEEALEKGLQCALKLIG